MKVIVTERIAQEGIDYLIENGFDVDVRYGISREELLDIIDNYDAIIVRSVTKVDAELISKSSRLKVAGRAGNGIDNIDVKACTERGIIVVNTPESNIMAAAELAVALSFCVFRNIYQAVYGGKVAKDFRRNRFIGNEVDEKTVGIIGLGRIGSIVARKLAGCNMKVVAYDPYIPDEKFDQVGCKRCATLDELLRVADLITIHTPKTPETVGIIGAEEIAKCKDGVRIVNAARGGLVDEDALYDGLVSGKVAGAALDVLNPEPSYDKDPKDQDYTNRLLELDNFIATPHLGASTEEANYNVGTAVTKLVGDALLGKMVAAVNMPSIQGNLNELKPYLSIAESLGKIYYQAEKEVVKRIEVVYSGDLAKKEGTKIITYSIIKGFLETVVKEQVNYVNAEMLLKQRGIELVESKKTNIDKYSNLITVKFITANRVLQVAGTVFGIDTVRIVDFFGYKLDFEPTEHVLAIQNVDRPGIIGKVGTILGEFGVNIAAMQWSRNTHGGKAVSFVSVDVEVGEEVINKLKETDGILLVSKLTL